MSMGKPVIMTVTPHGPPNSYLEEMPVSADHAADITAHVWC